MRGLARGAGRVNFRRHHQNRMAAIRWWARKVTIDSSVAIKKLID
jgi:hypothetical protein